MTWKERIGHKGIKRPCVHPKPHFIFRSVRLGRKQSQVTDRLLITPGLPPFRKTKADGGHCANCDPVLLRHVTGFHLKRTVAALFFLSVKAWLDGLLGHFNGSGIDGFYWLNILPVMTWRKTLLITWNPGHCGSNWADLCQLQSSRLASLARRRSQLLKVFPVSAQKCFYTGMHHWKIKIKKPQGAYNKFPKNNLSLHSYSKTS